MNFIKKSSLFLAIVVVTLSTAFVLIPQAQASACTDPGGFLSFPRWYEYLDVDSDCNVSAISYPDGGANIGATIGAVLLAVIEILLRIAGIVAVGFIVYGGIRYTMSQGVPDKLQAARQTIINGIIGVVIASLAVAIVNLFSNIIT